MDKFHAGFGTGALATFLGLMLIAHLVFSETDDLCAKQGWKGEACQCRLLDKNEPKPCPPPNSTSGSVPPSAVNESCLACRKMPSASELAWPASRSRSTRRAS